jgi:hypothetical protein
MSERECAACGRPVSVGRCGCGATWPPVGRGYRWAGIGLLLTPVSAIAAYGAVVLAGRTVFERPSLGPEATATGAIMVGVAVLVALAGPAAFARSWRLLGDRRAALSGPPSSVQGRVAAAVDEACSRVANAAQRGGMAVGTVAAGVVLWVLVYAAAGVVPRPAFVAGTFAAWGAVPLGIAIDSERPAGARWFTTLAVVPFFAAVGGGGYLLARTRKK